MPNVKKGELLAGAQFYRTQGWMEAMSSPTEPAITTVGRYTHMFSHFAIL